MAELIIEGGSRLVGEISSSGSKNGALALMAATLLVEGEVTIHNVPHIGDVYNMIEVLRSLGAKAELLPTGVLVVNASTITTNEPPQDLVKKMRASFYVLGPLLARTGMARVAIPGGCDIGSRKIDFHRKGLGLLGAIVRNEHGIIEATADRLRGAKIYLDFPSAGATQQIMTAAALAHGTTVIENAACEPEVADLARFLIRCGAKINGAGTGTVEIEGVKKLYPVEYVNIPDRVEIGTYAIAAANTKGDVFIRNAPEEHSSAVIEKLREIGVGVARDSDGIHIVCKRRVLATDIVTMPFPGFPTDLQQPMGALLTTAEGTSVITEKVYEHRFRYLSELERMGGDYITENQTAIIKGVPSLHGAKVNACDLRAGAALVIASLAAEGITEISDMQHVYRGYENLERKLLSLGAKVSSGEMAACLE